jgi:hypothetical protein
VPSRCNPTDPFMAPVPVEGLNSAADDVTARFSPDELTVVFARRTGAGMGLYDLYTAKRAARELPFETPSLLATLNSVNSEYWPSLSPDGLLLAFGSDRSTGMIHIYTTTRASVTSTFAPPTIAAALMVNDEHPYIANARAMYFSATRTGGAGMRDIWRAEIDSTGATSMAQAILGGVNTANEEVGAALTEDELTIFFRRTVGAEHDIYTATRTTSSDGFGAATPVPVLSMPGLNEIANWVSPDGCSLYVQLVNAPGGMGGDDLYVARRGSP